MALNRLAALRAERQTQDPGSRPVSQEQDQGYELPVLGSSSSQANGTGNDFLNEISAIQDLISEFNDNVKKISTLHSRALGVVLEGEGQQTLALLDDQVAKTRDLGNQVKKRIEALKMQPIRHGQESKRDQITVVANQFMTALRSYTEVETDYRQKQRQRIERQVKIVKPDATAEEMKAVVDNAEGGEQIFASALTQTRRYGESRTAHREVQDRHEDIRKIERTLEDVAQLMNDMSVLIAQQDEIIGDIEDQTGQVERDTAKGQQHMDKAVASARSARRKRIIFFWLFILLLCIIGAIVGAVVGTRHS